MQKSRVSSRRFSALIITVLLLSIAQAQYSLNLKSKEKTKLRGRVVASINSITFGVWHPKYQSFLFLPTEKSNQKQDSKPVRIVYEFFGRDNYLKKDFFDRSRLYELKVTRQTNCDEKLKQFGYETLVENADGQRVETKISILKVLDGVDENIFDENEILPCYTLQENDYKLKTES